MYFTYSRWTSITALFSDWVQVCETLKDQKPKRQINAFFMYNMYSHPFRFCLRCANTTAKLTTINYKTIDFKKYTTGLLFFTKIQQKKVSVMRYFYTLNLTHLNAPHLFKAYG